MIYVMRDELNAKVINHDSHNNPSSISLTRLLPEYFLIHSCCCRKVPITTFVFQPAETFHMAERDLALTSESMGKY